MLHYRAWELGIKSLYYLRSKTVQRAGFAGGVEADNTPDLREIELQTTDYDECLAASDAVIAAQSGLLRAARPRLGLRRCDG